MPVFAGFDLGGTQIKFGLVDGRGNVLFESRVDTPQTLESVFATMESLWEDLKQKAGGRIQAAGFGFPGIFHTREQKIYQSPNYPDLDRSELAPALSHFIRIPFYINNDANLAAFGEYRRGAGRGTRSLVLLTIGTGVGSGIILGGDIWTGTCGFAGELGHICVNPGGAACQCGSRGCLETEVSAGKIGENYLAMSGKGRILSAEEVARRARKGDTAAREAFTKAARYLGIGLGITINILNPEKILLGGGVMNSGDLLLPAAVEEASRRSFRDSFACTKIQAAILGNQAGFIGAALWARHQLRLSRPC